MSREQVKHASNLLSHSNVDDTTIYMILGGLKNKLIRRVCSKTLNSVQPAE